MPFTFLAHQAPVLPLKRRWPEHFDGVALIIGSMLPDTWYMTVGWLYGPAGLPMWVDGHQVTALLNTVVLPGILLTWAVRRWVLDDREKRSTWLTATSALIGGVTHLALDQLTHWNVAGLPVGQAVSSAVLMVLAVWMLQRWWPGWQNRFQPLDRRGLKVLASFAAVGVVWGLARGGHEWHARFFTATNLAGLGWVVGSAVSRRRSAG